MEKKEIKFSVVQKTVIAELIKSVLAATRVKPFDIPEKKTPFIEMAKERGFRHTEGIVIANKIIEKFKSRAFDIREYDKKFNAAIKTLVVSEWMDEISTEKMKDHLKKHGLKTTKAEIELAKCSLLEMQVEYSFTKNYRCCKNGSVTVTCFKADKNRSAHKLFSQRESYCRDIYRGKYKDWGVKVIDTSIKIYSDYHDRVDSLVFVGDHYEHFVLDAKRIKINKQTGIAIFEVFALVQGRGNNVKLTRLIVAKKGLVEGIGETEEIAIAKLNKKLRKAA